MGRRAVVVALVLGASACASTPRANAPPSADRAAPAPRSEGDVREGSPLVFGAGAKRYVVIGQRSRLDVKGHDSMLGDHHLQFGRWWAHIDTDPPKIVVDIDLRSLHSNEAFVGSIVKNEMLEVDRYPHATLVGTLSVSSSPDEIVIDGIADVHGRRIPLRFTGTIHEEGAGYRLQASFVLSRSAFHLHYTPAEPFLDDGFRISVDAVASEERVEVEEN